MAKNYTDESIKSLKGAQRVRKRPAVIFGSDGIEGCKHSVFEILSNSIDEAREGYGNKITLIIKKDNSITISDQGRGIPVGYNRKEKKYNWELLFTELYAGGKYDTNKGDNYNYSLGLNGLGLCATQYASKWMNAEIIRDSKKYSLNFIEGENIGGLKSEKVKNKKTGTTISWLPDLDVFTSIEIEAEYFRTLLKEQAVVNKGIEFLFIDEKNNKEELFFYKEGIKDRIVELAGKKTISEMFYLKDNAKGRDRKDHNDYHVKYEMAFIFTNENPELMYFHNASSLTYGGSPDLAVKTAFLYEVDRFLKQTNKYKKNESMINFSDIQESLLLICNSFSTQTSYENQTKKSINNNFIRKFLTESFRKNIEVMFTENPQATEKILDQIMINKRSRERADVARTAIKKKLTSKIDLTNKVDKFVDCRSKDKNKRELFIVEGDSALGACKLARDANFQALMPVRGKPLNTLKSDPNRIFKNDIIMDLLKIIGAGIEISSNGKKSPETFSMKTLNYDKIIITTDADVDGYQIRTLILTMFYRLVPTLLKEGKVFIVESPLYEIVSKSKSYFAYNEQEKKDIIEKINDNKAIIHRSKGLGENDPEMMWQTTMNPKTRKLIKVIYTGCNEAKNSFNSLLGDDLDERKRIIEEKGSFYYDYLDLS